MRGWMAIVALAAALGCAGGSKIPGQVIATLTFDAGLISGSAPDFTGPAFGFLATLSTDNPAPGSAVSHAYLTVAGLTRDAGFDGQLFWSHSSAPRDYAGCACGEHVQTDETFVVALLSPSEDQALGRSCPPGLLDGGLPPLDGGIPGPRAAVGFDVVRACGLLTDVFTPDPAAGCSCPPSTAVFQLVGVP